MEDDFLYITFEVEHWFSSLYKVPNIFKGVEMKKTIEILHPKGIENMTYSYIPRQSKKHLKRLVKAKPNLRHFYFLGEKGFSVYKILIRNGLEEGSAVRITYKEIIPIIVSAFDLEYKYFYFFI